MSRRYVIIRIYFFKSLSGATKILMHERFWFQLKNYIFYYVYSLFLLFHIILPRPGHRYILETSLFTYLSFHFVLGLVINVIIICPYGFRHKSAARVIFIQINIFIKIWFYLYFGYYFFYTLYFPGSAFIFWSILYYVNLYSFDFDQLLPLCLFYSKVSFI